MARSANALVREALHEGWLAAAGLGGPLEGVTVLPEPPHNYLDLYGASRGVLDLIFLDESVGTSEQGSICGSGVDMIEQIQHQVVIQVDRQPDNWTQALVDERCDELMGIVNGLIGQDYTLGIDYKAEGLRTLRVLPGHGTYQRTILDSGGTRTGHSGRWTLTVEAMSSAIHSTPALP